MVWSKSETKLLFVSLLYSIYYILRYNFNKICSDLSFVEKFLTYFIELLVSNRCAS
jgi:hypothetical protein